VRDRRGASRRLKPKPRRTLPHEPERPDRNDRPMTQQINLADPRLLPQKVAFGARHALAAVVAVLVVGAAGASALNTLTAGLAREAQNAPVAPAAAASRHAQHVSDLDVEIQRLRASDAGHRRILAALDAGVAGERVGPSGYFVALARQASGAVWITGLSVSDDGSALDLEGRMGAPHLLPGYLRRLNAEPRFRGRPFEQLSLKGANAGDGTALPYSEFTLRSKAAKNP
jgi:hypothetical protein